VCGQECQDALENHQKEVEEAMKNCDDKCKEELMA